MIKKLSIYLVFYQLLFCIPEIKEMCKNLDYYESKNLEDPEIKNNPTKLEEIEEKIEFQNFAKRYLINDQEVKNSKKGAFGFVEVKDCSEIAFEEKEKGFQCAIKTIKVDNKHF